MDAEERDSTQCFRPLAGMRMVYEPACAGRGNLAKHPCEDCHFCQFCSDDRCNACRGKRNDPRGACRRKLSVKEQILLYEQMNTEDGQE